MNKRQPFSPVNRRNVLIALLLIPLLIGAGIQIETAEARPMDSGDQIPLASSASHCPALSPPGGPTVTVSTEAALRQQAANAASGTTILVAAGTYNLADVVQVLHNNITIRGITGNRDDVILDAGGMITGHTHAIYIDADDVTIADLTIRNAGEHGVSIQGRDRPVLYNLHILDTGYQLVKVNPLLDGSDDGLLACSRLEYTTTSPEDYTNGISAHNAHRWVVRDNEWYRIRTPNNVPAPAILFWSGSSDTIVERNLLVNCYQGIAFGNASHDSGDHLGGIVRNNFIYAGLRHDSVIEMVHATGWLVAHNTALLLNPEPGLTWGMEARFSDTTGTYAYNLTNLDILNRDGARGFLTGNVTSANAAWFEAPTAGNLHLLPTATAAIDQAVTLAQVEDDYDGIARPIGSAPDIGADEYDPDTVPVIETLRFRSNGTLDGWVLESSRTSSMGGLLNSDNSVFVIGDHATGRQYRAVLSFNTSPIPESAVITRVILKIKKQGVVGVDPFTTHGNLLIDVRRGSFNRNLVLEAADFQAFASKGGVGVIPNRSASNWYSKVWTSGVFPYINTIGLTQFRLRFSRGDDGDLRSDYLKFFSGNYAVIGDRPVLIVDYYVPR